MLNSVMIFGNIYEGDKKEFKKLQELLKSMGISMIHDGKGSEEHVSIVWDDGKIKKIKSRGAGKKEKFVIGDGGCPITLSEVEDMIKELGADETAVKLGIGRATLFRRLKRARADRELFGDDAYL